jgi:cation transport protein ChaC
MWIFGYGSLMWDGWEQEFGCLRSEEAELPSFRRDFNKASTRRWGTESAPGPTLGLEPTEAATCVGVAFNFADARREEILSQLKHREGPHFSLLEHVVQLRGGDRVPALIPINDRNAKTYIGSRTIAERVLMARTASGTAGRCSDYVANVRQELARRGVHDPCVERFCSAVSGHLMQDDRA